MLLHSSGIRSLPEQMEQLSSMTAAEPNPPLKVLSVDMLDGESDKVLLRCEHPNTCLPFYVLVHWGQSGETDRAGLAGQTRTRSNLVRSRKTCWFAAERPSVLVLDGEYIHMTLPVLCLQNGGRGQQVRVISKETKKRYVARVTGPGVVTSALSE